MPDKITGESWEPSAQSKRCWLWTRKNPTLHAGVLLPGLFQTAGFRGDLFAVIVAVFLEIYGLVNLWLVSATLAPVMVIGLFFFDVLLALLHHAPRGRKTLRANRLVLARDEDDRARIQGSLPWWNFVAPLAATGILAIAAFKIVSFATMAGTLFSGASLAVMASYLVVAFCHLRSTGYVFSELVTAAYFGRDRRRHLSEDRRDGSTTISSYRRHAFHTAQRLAQASVGPHRLRYEGLDGEGRHRHVLETWGLVSDNQRDDLICQQDNREQRSTLALAILQHQLDQLEMEAAGGGHEGSDGPGPGNGGEPTPSLDGLRDGRWQDAGSEPRDDAEIDLVPPFPGSSNPRPGSAASPARRQEESESCSDRFLPFLLTACFLPLGLVLGGCAEPRQAVSERPVALDVIVVGGDGPSDAVRAKSVLADLMAPLTEAIDPDPSARREQAAESNAWIPSIRLMSLSEEIEPLVLLPGREDGLTRVVKGFWGSHTSLQALENTARKTAEAIDPDLLAPLCAASPAVSKPSEMTRAVARHLEKSGDAKVAWLRPEDDGENRRDLEVNGISVPRFSDTESMREFLTEELVASASSSSKIDSDKRPVPAKENSLPPPSCVVLLDLSSPAPRANHVTASVHPAEPATSEDIVLEIAADRFAGERLAVPLAEGFLRSRCLDGTVVRETTAAAETGEALVTLRGRSRDGEGAFSIEISVLGSPREGRSSMIEGEVEMLLTTHRSDIPEPGHDGAESPELPGQVVAIDAVAVVVHPANPLGSLSLERLADLLAGRPLTWADLGTPSGVMNGPVRFLRGGIDLSSFASSVLPLAPTGVKGESVHETDGDDFDLARRIAADPGSLGLVSLVAVGGNRPLALTSPGMAGSSEPTRFAVLREDYPLARRIRLYRNPVISDQNRRRAAEAFARFATGETGQQIVSTSGFFPLEIDVSPTRPLRSGEPLPEAYRKATAHARQLTTTFRFDKGSSDFQLDERARADVDRLVEFLDRPENRKKEILLLGFTCDLGGEETNLALSRERAEVVRGILVGRGIPVALALGFGEALPVSPDREQNRRVELWIKDRATLELPGRADSVAATPGERPTNVLP